MNSRFLTIFCLIWFIGCCSVEAAAVINFANGDDLDGDDVGGTASFLDSATGVTGTLTTRAIGPSGVLNANQDSLGVNSGSGSGSRFDNGEFWTFDWDVDASLTGINLGLFTSAGSESFTIQSNDWIGLAGVTPGSLSVTFLSAAGSFTLSDKDGSDEFTLGDLTGGTALDVTAGTDIAISYANTGTDDSIIEGLSFSLSSATAIPEPSSLAVLAVGGLIAIARRRRAKPTK